MSSSTKSRKNSPERRPAAADTANNPNSMIDFIQSALKAHSEKIRKNPSQTLEQAKARAREARMLCDLMGWLDVYNAVRQRRESEDAKKREEGSAKERLIRKLDRLLEAQKEEEAARQLAFPQRAGRANEHSSC